MSEKKLRPIMVQGAMPIEAERFAARLEQVSVERTGNFAYYSGLLDGYPVIMVKTSKGVENAAAATAIGIERYQPIAIINQGTAGGHDPALQVGDIVIGTKVTPIGNLKTCDLGEGEGCKPFDWKPMDVMASEGSAGEDKNAEKVRYYEADPALLEVACRMKNTYGHGKVVEGIIGSANLWNNEIDRIRWYRERYGTSAEEMESAAAAQMCAAYGTPFLGIRVLSNNKTNNGAYNPTTAEYCQEFVFGVVREYVRDLKK